jgi:hypothetical protein
MTCGAAGAIAVQWLGTGCNGTLVSNETLPLGCATIGGSSGTPAVTQCSGQNPPSPGPKSPSPSLVAGAVIGSLLGAAVVLGGALMYRRRLSGGSSALAAGADQRLLPT